MRKHFITLTILILIITSGVLLTLIQNNNNNKEVKIINEPVNRKIEGIQAVDDLNDIDYSNLKKQFFISSFDESKIYVLDPGTFAIVGEVPFNLPHKILIIDNSTEMYVSAGDGRVMEVSLETFKPGRELEVGDRPANMAMDLKRNSLLVLDELSDNLSVIDRATFKRKKLISVSKKPVDIEIDQTGNYAYIASDGDGLVDILSLDSLALVGTITNVGRPGKLFTYPRENLLLLLDEFNNRLHVIDTLKNQVKSSIDVVNLPTSMDVDTERDLVYVTSFTDSQVGVIDLNQEKMVEVIQLRALFDSVSGLNNVALDADLGQIIVTNTVTGQVFMVKVQ